jgi:hypothetical protein
VPKFDFLPLLRYLLRRLVRISIGSGITYQTFCKVLRAVYFEIGQEFEPVKGKPNSDSRISLLTGLPRREVRSLRESPPEALAPAPSIERLVMDAWSPKLEFIDEQGRMLPLPRTARQGGDRSFEKLVEGISKDIRARALLDEWLRQGHVILDEDDRVVVAGVRPASKIEGAQGAGLLMGEMTSDLLDGFERSYVLGQPVPGYAFQVSYGHRLTAESAQLICSVALREGTEFANRINRLIVERETLDAKRSDAHRRVTVGFLAYETDEVTAPGLLSPAAQDRAA